MALCYESDVNALEQHGVAEEVQFDRVSEGAVGAADVPSEDPS
jgi:hypothetical protein